MLSRFLVAVLFAAVIASQVQAADCEEVKNLPAKELARFLRTSADTSDPQCVTEAIRTLGALKPEDKASIDVLIGLLDFRRPETDAERMHLSSTRDWFPAVSALVAVGQPAVEQLIGRLKNNEMTETVRQNGIRAILYIYSGDPPKAVAMLRQAAEGTESQLEAVALETSAKDAAKLCAKMVGKSGKSRCEAALGQKLED